MLYKDLPPEILEIALLRQKEAGNPENVEISFLNSAAYGGFNYSNTVEGLIVWNTVYHGDFEPFYKMYPERRPANLKMKDGVELPKEIQELVCERFFEEKGYYIPLGCLFPGLANVEGLDFWRKIAQGDFTEFYKRYPKEDNSQTVAQEAPKSLTPIGKDGFPRKMQVRNYDKNSWRIVTVVAIYNGKAHGFADIENKRFESGDQYLMHQWDQWREIEGVLEITQSKIEEVLGYKIQILNP